MSGDLGAIGGWRKVSSLKLVIPFVDIQFSFVYPSPHHS